MRQVNGEEFLQEVENYYEREEGMRTIDITPKWEALIPVMVTILRNPQASSDSVRFVQDELIRIARAVDKQNEERKN